MTELRCPVCEAGAATVGSGIDLDVADGTFDRRGKVGRYPVFICRECRATLIVKRRLLGGLAVRVVDGETAAEMDMAWVTDRIEHSEARRQQQASGRRQQALADGGAECPHCGKVLRGEQGLRAHLDVVHGGA